MALSKRETREIVDRVISDVRALPQRRTSDIRTVRRRTSKDLKNASGRDVVAVALGLRNSPLRWVGYELVQQHRAALQSLGLEDVEALGQGIRSWGEVDAFGIYIAGRAWLNGQIPDRAVRNWAKGPDIWWRRTALVATVVLNSKSHGGSGDAKRTLEIAELLADDREDMVIKALSWALRTLVPWDAGAVRKFLEDNESLLAARVKREVRTKLETGRKNR